MKETTLPLLEEAPGVPTRAGFFYCSRCKAVVTLSQQQVDAAENAPAGSLMKLKCPGCHHWDVQWKFPQVPKVKPAPQPVSLERGQELFAALKEAVA